MVCESNDVLQGRGYLASCEGLDVSNPYVVLPVVS